MLQKDVQQQLRDEFRANHDRIAALARPLDPERLIRRPSPGSWSVGEVLEHLTLMDALFLAPVGNLVRSTRPDAAAPSREYKPSLIGKWVSDTLRASKPLKSPKAAVPRAARPGVVEAFLAGDAEYRSLMERGASLDWNAVRLHPPVLPPWIPVRMNIGDAFRIHVVHVKRHITQIERALATQ